MPKLFPLHEQGFNPRAPEDVLNEVDPRELPALSDSLQSLRHLANKLGPEARDALLYSGIDEVPEIRMALVEQSLELLDRRATIAPDVAYFQAGKEIDRDQFSKINEDEWVKPT